MNQQGSKKEFNKLKHLKYCTNLREACKNSDLVIIHTEWNEFKQLNFKTLVRKNNFKIYDMRNLYSPEKMKKNKLNYYCIGR
jgi:Predicted UDP-glucose 6-dehydrogenase